MSTTTATGMHVERQAGALGAIVTGVDLADLDDATFAALHDALLEHLVICIRGQEHLTPEQQIAFSARWGRIEPHPYVPPIDGYPEIMEVYDPNPITVTWHADFTYAKQPPAISLLLGRIIPPVGGDTMFSNGYLAYENLSARPARDRSTDSAPSTTRPSWRSRSGMPEDEIVNSHPVACTHPETGPQGAVRQRQLHPALRELERGGQPAAARAPVPRSSPGSSTRGATTGRRATSSSGTTAARSTRSSATPPARSGRCTARRSPETPRDDRHPLDREPRRPRRRAARHLDQPAAREVPRHRPAHRDGAARARRSSTAAPTARSPGTEGDPVAWWFYEDQQYSVKRLIAAAGYPADEITLRGRSPSTRCGPGAGSRRRASTT